MNENDEKVEVKKANKVELLDIYDKNGSPTGRTIVRGDKNIIFNDDEFIALSIIFIENDKGEFLIQKTSKEKLGEYSSTGGHVNSGETPKDAIIREIKEELGIDISKDDIVELGFLHFDMPLRYLFYLKKNIDLKDIVTQKDEVDFVRYMSIEKINEIINKDEMLKSHGILFKELLKIKNKL